MRASLPTESRMIGNHTYYVTRLGFSDARRLLELSEKLLGPAILQMLTEGGDLLDLEARSVIGPLLGVLGRLGGEQSDQVFRFLGSATHVMEDGREEYLTLEAQDQWWALYPGEVLGWLMFAYEVQFRDFFAGAGRLAGLKLRGEGKK